MRRYDFFEILEDEVLKQNITESERNSFIKRLNEVRNQEINIMITGATGCGKSSTINALFNTNVATVGVGVDPETMSIEKYNLDNIVLWDTPGLGDGKEADICHAKNIIDKLNEFDEEGNALIDVVLVILDGGSRNLGTEFELINNVIIPNLGENQKHRLLVAINQADMAMKGRNWDYENSQPNDILKNFLDEKVVSVRNRIMEATGVSVDPIYYSAGYTDDNGVQSKPYNLSKLLYYILEATPIKKRAIYVNNLNPDTTMWEENDEIMDYNREVGKNIVESVIGFASGGGELGEKIGVLIGGPTGGVIGRVVGTVLGAIGGFFAGLFG